MTTGDGWPQVEYVRRCRVCHVTKALSRYGGRGHLSRVCRRCYEPPTSPGMIAKARGIVITKLGYMDLHEMRRGA